MSHKNPIDSYSSDENCKGFLSKKNSPRLSHESYAATRIEREYAHACGDSRYTEKFLISFVCFCHSFLL